LEALFPVDNSIALPANQASREKFKTRQRPSNTQLLYNDSSPLPEKCEYKRKRVVPKATAQWLGATCLCSTPLQIVQHLTLSLEAFFEIGGQKLRPVLESFGRNLYPSHFADQDMMGTIVRKIRTADSAHPLDPVVDDFDDINIYCTSEIVLTTGLPASRRTSAEGTRSSSSRAGVVDVLMGVGVAGVGAGVLVG
jgi:hypothetical protein